MIWTKKIIMEFVIQTTSTLIGYGIAVQLNVFIGVCIGVVVANVSSHINAIRNYK